MAIGFHHPKCAGLPSQRGRSPSPPPLAEQVVLDTEADRRVTGGLEARGPSGGDTKDTRDFQDTQALLDTKEFQGSQVQDIRIQDVQDTRDVSASPLLLINKGTGPQVRVARWGQESTGHGRAHRAVCAVRVRRWFY